MGLQQLAAHFSDQTFGLRVDFDDATFAGQKRNYRFRCVLEKRVIFRFGNAPLFVARALIGFGKRDFDFADLRFDNFRHAAHQSRVFGELVRNHLGENLPMQAGDTQHLRGLNVLAETRHRALTCVVKNAFVGRTGDVLHQQIEQRGHGLVILARGRQLVHRLQIGRLQNKRHQLLQNRVMVFAKMVGEKFADRRLEHGKRLKSQKL